MHFKLLLSGKKSKYKTELVDNKYIITNIIRGGLLCDIEDVGGSESQLHAKPHAMCVEDAHEHGVGHTIDRSLVEGLHRLD